ncbi:MULTISPECIES: tetratricopeptide repeat protein [unclassified Bradyrhizobium]|uniref:tetratricopeptide repeat protein n=1 Tax=unclassified Bradyrhizobium TaxID=2631580 RepID=UPI00247A73F9|nr:MULTISPECIES: tetratricopeptide repeat protein [unclassified Bradyrhizobium]WGR74282.1 tetratricopeptide repeat protein [Bradyrhizobium sp. ISRA426]WGR79117.1 tetratricopeptide repeat protein [Bradyrhizobium sp. ISRA430]WGR89521.1 tetratricopeptide repeat protein [Bradyrhizobium sp. ISRA432]
MRRLSMLLVPGLVSMALAAGPVLTSAYAAGSDDPSPPPKSDSSSKKSKRKSSSISDPKFLAAYRTAYATIYDRHDYASAIDQLKSLKREDVADVANLIGYSYRKLGDYQQSKTYYELALKDDPNHVRTWQYYGLWQLEQGNREQAQYHLNKIASLAGTDSSEYRSLAAALDKPTGTTLVY